MNNKSRLIFFGNERLAAGLEPTPTLLPALLAAGYDIAAVVLSQEQLISSRRNRDPAVSSLAEQHNIPVLVPSRLGDIKQQLVGLKAQAGILAAYGKLIPADVLDIFPAGIINLHPSLLPKLRGPSPVESAITEGLEQTGVSIIKLVSQMDAGPVYGQEIVPLSKNEDKVQLAAKLAETGSALLLNLLPSILSGSLKPKSQDETVATYTKLISKADGQIDWNLPAELIDRQIRAYLKWPQSRTQIWGKDVIITKAHSVPGRPESFRPGDVEIIPEARILMLYASDGYVCIDKLKPAGKKEMSAAEFIRGYKP